MTTIRVLALAGAVLAVLSCGTTPERTLTAAEASRVVESVAATVPGALGPFTAVPRFPIDSSECEDPTDGGPLGRVSVGGYWTVRPSPPEAEVRDLIGRAADGYLRSGWVLLFDRRNVGSTASLGLERLSDGVRISFQGGIGSGLTYSVGSACVWPNGVPPGS